MTITRTKWTLAVSGVVLALTAGATAQTQITGSGATFPAPIYLKWFSEYNKLHNDVQINYQPVGSGAGIRSITNGTVFFGASDGPMTPDQMLAAPGKILHLPTVLGAVVPVFNVPNVTDIKFTGPMLANIFLGKITKWNDPAIATSNAGVNLPATDITVVHRSDGSGTSYIWNDYLAKVSPEWKQRVGVAQSVNWPVGLGGAKNDGVAALVKQTPGAIGYVELVYAIQTKLASGAVQNMAGKFVTATIASTTAAAAAAATHMPADYRVSITNPPGDDAFPISSFTWILLYQNPKDKARAAAMNGFMKWALTDGQKYASDLGYAPLPAAVVQLEMKTLDAIK
jgi:phosphate transport system substrate-binding protein